MQICVPLALDAVAAVVLHKHHLIIRVGAGLIQFVYGSHSRLAADLTLDKDLFPLPFSRIFRNVEDRNRQGAPLLTSIPQFQKR